jgi:NADH-quinone oxidoreductase subunit I
MSIKSTTQRIKDLWSLVKGLSVTGEALLKRTVTVHYPRAEVSNLAGFRGPIALVPKPGNPEKPKCIACMMCMSTCPSKCITVIKKKPPKPAAEQAEGGAEKKAKLAAPKEPQTFLYDYSLCSLCGLCAEVCPVDSICFSSEAYLVSRERGELKMNLLAKLKKNAPDASDQKAA